jgi:hypothetical protein
MRNLAKAVMNPHPQLWAICAGHRQRRFQWRLMSLEGTPRSGWLKGGFLFHGAVSLEAFRLFGFHWKQPELYLSRRLVVHSWKNDLVATTEEHWRTKNSYFNPTLKKTSIADATAFYKSL